MKIAPSENLLVRGIGELLCVPKGPLAGPRAAAIPRINNAALLIRNGRIDWFGPDAEARAPSTTPTLDAHGGCVVPGLIDCHTHTVFAGTREQEFVERIRGTSYAQIAERGGGIRVTVSAVRQADTSELIAQTLPRLARMLRNGVTTAEIKSGYGLTVHDELRILEAVQALDDLQPIDLVGTYLAAHIIPPEFQRRPAAYLDRMFKDELLHTIVERRFAEFCDVFCERTAFSVIQSRQCLTAALRHGLRPKVHADQISQIGASRLAAELHAISADHLEMIDDDGIAALKSAGTIAVLLPACSWFLGVHQAPARRLIDAHVPVAVATDYNPGSAMVESLPLTAAIACTQMRMTPDEVLAAITTNAAAAIARQDSIGAIVKDMAADLVILDVPTLNRWLYEPGRNCIRTVIKSGQVVYDARTSA